MEKIKAWFGNSLTVFLATLSAVVGVALDTVSTIPEFKQMVLDAFGIQDPHTIAWVTIGVSTVLLLARLRSLKKAE